MEWNFILHSVVWLKLIFVVGVVQIYANRKIYANNTTMEQNYEDKCE